MKKNIALFIVTLLATSLQAQANLSDTTICFNDKNGLLIEASPLGIKVYVAFKKMNSSGEDNVEITNLEDYTPKKTDFDIIYKYSLEPVSADYVLSYATSHGVRDGSFKFKNKSLLKKAIEVSEKHNSPLSDEERIEEANYVECATF